MSESRGVYMLSLAHAATVGRLAGDPAATLPEGVEYEELNDPHWWKAEVRAAKPRHVFVS